MTLTKMMMEWLCSDLAYNFVLVVLKSVCLVREVKINWVEKFLQELRYMRISKKP